MQNSKLIQLLRSLNKSEFREFKDYVNSPVFNKNKKIILFFDRLIKYYPAFDHKDLSIELFYNKIFPGERFDYFKIKNLTSDLFALGKEFLSFKFYRDHSNSKDKYLLEQLRDRNLDSIFEQTSNAVKKKIEKCVVKDEIYIQKNLELTEEILFYRIPKDPDSRLDFFQMELDLFLKYSFIRLLRYYNIMFHEKNQYNCKFNMSMFDEVMSYLKDNPSDNPTIQIYYNIILLSKENREEYFFELKRLKKKYLNELNPEDRYTLFMHMSNFCAYNFNVLGNQDFMKEHFLLSKESLENGTIHLGKLLYPDFLNHVKIAVRVNEFEWAEKYMKQHEQQLAEEKQSTLNFCYGYINYKNGNLEKALEYFSKTGFPVFILKIQVKILILQINFEMGYYEQAYSNIDAFRHYLHRENSMIEEYKSSYYDFLRLLNELIKLKAGAYKNDFEANSGLLKTNIENIKLNQFGMKLWLKEKAEELLQK